MSHDRHSIPKSHQPRTQLVELTSKKYKGMMLLGAVIAVVGGCGAVYFLFNAGADGPGFMMWASGIAFLFGFGLCVLARGLAWWSHG